jgi:hypothetical protein
MFHVKRGFAAGAAAAAAVVLTAGSAAASGWTVVSAPPTGQNVFLRGVSADSTSDAWAVGGPGRIADHWNGTSWQQATVPVSTSVSRFSLYAVSAASSTDAWAVGHGYEKSLAYHWDGHGWTQDGIYVDWLSVADLGPGNAYTAGPGLDHWDGSGWTAIQFPDPAGSSNVSLAAVSAGGANDIWAVGTYATNTTCSSCDTQTFALHWDGTSWNDVPMPPVDRSTDPNLEYRLTSVDAISPSDVWAAGYTDDLGSTSTLSTLIEHWNGASWSIVPAPSPGTAPRLTGISGTSPSSVWAVGYDTPAGASGPQTLTLYWDGTSWATVTSPNPDGPSQLEAVSSTPGSSTVWAAGLTGGTYDPSVGLSGSPNPLTLENS